MGQTSNIDDILVSQATVVKNQQPIEIESQAPEPEKELVQDVSPELTQETKEVEPEKEAEGDVYGNEPTGNSGQLDDYGNEKSAPKTYTEDEVNERIGLAIRERFAQLEKNNPAFTQKQSEQAQRQAQQGFEYDSNNPESWQQQLESFVEQVVMRIPQKQASIAHRQYEEHAEAEHRTKFQDGAKRFTDFYDVVSKQPFTDAMTIATRGIQDPAAFVYAASKRAPDELKKISEMRDPYAQMVAIGKLEERMKQSKPTTKTPKPVEQTKGDVAVPHKSEKYPTIEEQIAQDAKRRLELQRQRRR